MEQQGQIASNYQVQYIPQTSGSLAITGGVYDYDSMIELIIGPNTVALGTGNVLLCRKEAWQWLTQATITKDGVQIGQFINLGIAQNNYYQRFMKDQKDIFGLPAAALSPIGQAIGKKQWNYIQQGSNAIGQSFSIMMPLHHFLAGCLDPSSRKFRVWNQMTINVQQRGFVGYLTDVTHQTADADFYYSAGLSDVVVPCAGTQSYGTTTCTYNLYGKIYPADPHIDQVLTRVQQQYFSSTQTVNCNFSIGANQVSKYQALSIVRGSAPLGIATQIGAVLFDEPLAIYTTVADTTNVQGNVGFVNIQRNGYNLLQSQNQSTNFLTNNQLAQLFSMLADNENLNQNTLCATFGNVFSNSIINHVISTGQKEDFYFTYQIQEANPNVMNQ